METVGLCVLMLACFLYRIEERVFKKVNLYGIVYDVGSSICSLVASIIPLLKTGPNIGLNQVHVASLVVDTQVRSHGHSGQWMVEGINPVLLTNEEGIDIFETETAQEQSVREHARKPNLNIHLKNQHLNQHLNQDIPSPLYSLMMISNILNQLSRCRDCPG